MLKLWVTGYKNKSNLTYMSPDGCFDFEIWDYGFLESDFARRLLYDCSGEIEVINYENFKRPNGLYISTREISSGAKNVLCMYALGNKGGIFYDLLWCGDNCNPYIAEVVQSNDVEAFSTRVYNPYDEVSPDFGFKVQIMETGDVVSNSDEFLDVIFENNLWKDL